MKEKVLIGGVEYIPKTKTDGTLRDILGKDLASELESYSEDTGTGCIDLLKILIERFLKESEMSFSQRMRSHERREMDRLLQEDCTRNLRFFNI